MCHGQAEATLLRSVSPTAGQEASGRAPSGARLRATAGGGLPGPWPESGKPRPPGLHTAFLCLPLMLLFLRVTRLRGVRHGQKETPAKDP